MKINDIIKELNSLTVLEAVKLAKQLEREWGVSSAIRIQIFNPEKDEPVVDEKTEFDVILKNCGARKIEVIKALRNIVPDLNLKEAKDMTETLNTLILRSVSKNVANEAKYLLEQAGAEITIL